MFTKNFMHQAKKQHTVGPKTISGLLTVVALAAFLSFPIPRTEAAGLTETQISSILGLLASFGADQTTIGKVNASLRGQTNSAPVSSGTASLGGSACPFVWNTNLGVGANSNDVTVLQRFLNSNADTMISSTGSGSVGQESTYYGPKTAAAVSKFQEKYAADILTPSNLTSGNGNFGNLTRAKANALCAKKSETTSTVPSIPWTAPANTNNGGGGGGGSAPAASQTPTGSNTSAPLPTLELSASRTTAYATDSVRLEWKSTNAVSCIASNGWSGSKATSGEYLFAITNTATYHLVCTSAEGNTVSKDITVTVLKDTINTDAPAAPTAPLPAAPSPLASVSAVLARVSSENTAPVHPLALTLSADKETLPSGGQVRLTWNSSNAVICTASGGWSGTQPLGGASKRNIVETTTFTLTCENGSHEVIEKEVTVDVQEAVAAVDDTSSDTPASTSTNAPLTLTFSATPNHLSAPGKVTFKWKSTGASACTASGAWAGKRGLARDNWTITVSKTGTFKLVCTNAAGEKIQKNVTVTVGK